MKHSSKNLTKIHNGLEKMTIILNNINNAIIDYRRQILNHPKILEYLFHRPINHYNNLTTMLKSCGGYDLPNHPISVSNITDIEGLFMLDLKLMEEYEYKYNIFNKTLEKYHLATNNHTNLKSKLAYNPIFKYNFAIDKTTTSNISNNIVIVDKIVDILDDLNISHTKYWSFTLCDQHTNANNTKPYCFNNKLNIDIFGCIKNKKKNKLIYFTIDTNTTKYTIDDYLKQASLCQMNVCLLRLVDHHHLKNQITHFLDKITSNNNHSIITTGKLSIGGLRNKSTSINTIIKMDNFYYNYQYNHDIYIKYYDKIIHDEYNILVELESSDTDDTIITTDTDLSVASVVTSGDFANLVNKKYFFTE